MIITKKGYNIKKKDKRKFFICDICKCEWIAFKDEYKEDWSKPILNHELPASKFGSNFIVTYGRIAAVAINEYCLEGVVIEDE